MGADANWWLDSPNGVEIGGSGFSATLRDYGRFGLFMLDGGIAGGDSILPAGWIREATSPKALRDGTSVAYGYLWWPGASAGSMRDGAYAARGLYGQFIYVNPVTRTVVVVWSAWAGPSENAVSLYWSFFEAVADSLRRAR